MIIAVSLIPVVLEFRRMRRTAAAGPLHQLSQDEAVAPGTVADR